MNHYSNQIRLIMATHCCVCRASLTDSESLNDGIGPVCSKRYYNPTHNPTDDQVKFALGHLSMSGLPEDIIDKFLTIVNNNHVNARSGCNLLIKWASANYGDRDMVFKCSAIIRALGYTELADKLEDDRTSATVRILPGHVEAFISDKYSLQRDMKNIPGATPIHNADGTPTKIGRKVGWAFPLDQREIFEIILGVHCGGELMCGTAGIRTIHRKRWADIADYQNRKKNPPANTTGGSIQIVMSCGRLEVYSPFNQDFITALKTTIPYRDRAWTGKCWAVTPLFREAIKNLITVHYGVTVN